MLYVYIGIGVAVLIVSIIFRITKVLGLLILPFMYALIAPTLFFNWFHSNQALAEGIGYGLIGLVALLWVLSLIGSIRERIYSRRDDDYAVAVFLDRLEQAKAEGRNDVSTEGLWPDDDEN